MVLRAALAARFVVAAKAAARRSLNAACLTAMAAVAAFFAISLAVVAGVMALSEVISPPLAAAAFAAAFLVISGVTAIFAGRAIARVTRPAAAAPALAPRETPPVEALVAFGVAALLGVLAGRAAQSRAKPRE